MKNLSICISTLALAGLFILPTPVTAQADFFGYFESEVDILGLRNKIYNIGYNKLRIDMDANTADGIEIGANFIAQFYNGNLGIDPRLYLPDRLVDDYTEIFGPLEPGVAIDPIFTDSTFLDNAYMRLSKGPLDITFGRQQISFGVGYTWNPTDIFNAKNMIDPTYEQRGVDATRVDAALPMNFSLTAVVQPQGDIWSSSQYYRLKHGFGAVDVSASYSHVMPGFKNYRDIFGLNVEGELLGLGLRTEVAVNRFDFGEYTYKLEYIIGADYTTESSLYFLTEYLYNGNGLEQDSGAISDYLDYYLGGEHSLNQNYLFLLGQYPASDVMIVGAFAIANLDDGSMIIAPDVQYSLMESVDLNATIMFAVGDENTEFGIQKLGARVRLRAYF